MQSPVEQTIPGQPRLGIASTGASSLFLSFIVTFDLLFRKSNLKERKRFPRSALASKTDAPAHIASRTLAKPERLFEVHMNAWIFVFVLDLITALLGAFVYSVDLPHAEKFLAPSPAQSQIPSRLRPAIKMLMKPVLRQAQ